MRTFIPAIAAVLLVLWASDAEARSFRSSQIPNARGCDACHSFPGGPLTPLGAQIRENLIGGNASWRRVFDLDADGDGFSNGEELGDAFGEWNQGDASPTELSNPNEDFSIPISVGTAPVASDQTLEILEDEVYEGTLPFDDPDDNVFRPRIIEPPENGTFEIVGTDGEFVYTPEAGWSGVDSFTWLVFDGSNLSGVAEVVINVAEVNDVPVFEPALEPEFQIREGSRVSFPVNAVDEEDGPLEVSHSTLPNGARFNPDSGVFAWEPEPGSAGRYEVEFSARDSGQQRVAQTVVIEVSRVNQAPTLSIVGPGEAIEGDTLTWTIEGEDADGDPLTFEWAFDEEPVETASALETVSRTFAQDGDFTLTVVLSDGFGEVSRRITIQIDNALPTVNAGDDVEIEPGDTVRFEGQFTEPGPEDVNLLEWDFGDGSPVVEGMASVSHTYNQSGVFIAVFKVSDEFGQAVDGVRVQVGGGGNMEPEPVPDMEPDGMCMPGGTVACLGDQGCIGNAVCGADGTAGVCVCGGNGGGGGGDGGGGCSTAPGQGGGVVWGLLLALFVGIFRRRTAF